jgi:hypothetical protein
MIKAVSGTKDGISLNRWIGKNSGEQAAPLRTSPNTHILRIIHQVRNVVNEGIRGGTEK